mgnify:CR=1 FL=1
MICLGLKKIELDKWRGYWRAKGFRDSRVKEQPLRIDRGDYHIAFEKKKWVSYDDKGKAVNSNEMLYPLLKTIS